MNVITITGTGHYHGQEFITPGMKIRLIKDPDNEYDREESGRSSRDWGRSAMWQTARTPSLGRA